MRTELDTSNYHKAIEIQYIYVLIQSFSSLMRYFRTILNLIISTAILIRFFTLL